MDQLSKTFDGLFLTPYLAVFVILIVILMMMDHRIIWCSKKKGFSGKSIKDIPGPFSLPFFGTRWIYGWFGCYNVVKVHEVYADLFKRYGPIVKEEALNNFPIINIVDKQDIEKVCKSIGKYPIRPPTEVISYYRKSRPDRYTSSGMVNEQGIIWHNLRVGLTTELTNSLSILSIQPELEKISQDLCDLLRLKRTPDGFIPDMQSYSEKLGLEASCSLVLGRRMGFLLPDIVSPNALLLIKAVRDSFVACRDTFFPLPFWKVLPTKSYKLLSESEEAIYMLATEMIKSADEEARESAVFQSIVNANIDECEKRAAIVDFMVAGIKTLGNSLIFLLYLLGKNPECQEKLLQDLNSGSKSYLKACITESFRLIPTAYCFSRILEQDVELAGFQVQAGSAIICHTGVACKDEKNFPDPLTFKPERWLGDLRNDTLSSGSYIFSPFGIGRRMCPGKRFSELCLSCVLTDIIKNFRVSSPQDIELQCEFILAAKSPLSFKLEDRC